MKAFKIQWPDIKKRRLVDLGYRYDLPRIHCPECGKTWGQDFEYPGFRFDFLNDREFTFDRVVTLGEFEKIRNRIVCAVGRPVLLIAGGGIGELAGKAISARLDDFAWGSTICPQISKRARDLLADEGISLTTADVSIRCGGKKIATHLALHVEPVALLTEESLKRHRITYCPVCGDFDQYYPKPRVEEGQMIKRSLWPERQHLVTVAETLDVLATAEFMEAVNKHELTGIHFAECGQYV